MKYLFCFAGEDDSIIMPYPSRPADDAAIAEKETKTIDILAGVEITETKTRCEFKNPAVIAETKVFSEGKNLCVYDGERIFTLSLGEIVGIRKISQGISTIGWNKHGRPSGKRYREAGVMLFKDECYGLSYFHAIEFLHAGEQYRLLFPAYELLTIMDMIPSEVLLEEKKPEEKIRPVYYWKIPKNAGSFISPAADVSFKAARPFAYKVLMTFAVIGFFLPMVLYIIAIVCIQDMCKNHWVLLGLFGSMIVGIGFFNLTAAWLRQYLGHFFTIGCFLTGGAMVAVTFLILLH